MVWALWRTVSRSCSETDRKRSRFLSSERGRLLISESGRFKEVHSSIGRARGPGEAGLEPRGRCALLTTPEGLTLKIVTEVCRGTKKGEYACGQMKPYTRRCTQPQGATMQAFRPTVLAAVLA